MSRPTNTTAAAMAFRDWFGVEAGSANVLLALFEANGQPLTRDQLAKRTGIGPKAAHTHIARLRTAMETGAIDTPGFAIPQRGDRGGMLPSLGYALTEEGLVECQAALRKVAGELLTMVEGRAE